MLVCVFSDRSIYEDGKCSVVNSRLRLQEPLDANVKQTVCFWASPVNSVSLQTVQSASASPLTCFVMVTGPQASPSPSPVGYSPMTPGAPSPGGYNPHTPGSNIEQGSSDWVTTDILVRVKDSFMDLMGQTGVIRSVTVTNTVTTSSHQSYDLTSVLISIRLRYEGRSEKQSISLDPDSLINSLIWTMIESPMVHVCVRRVDISWSVSTMTERRDNTCWSRSGGNVSAAS